MVEAAKIIGRGGADVGRGAVFGALILGVARNPSLRGQLFSYVILGFAEATGAVFGALILGVARNPSLRGQLFSYVILGFAFAEATGLFALMMAFLLLYVA